MRTAHLLLVLCAACAGKSPPPASAQAARSTDPHHVLDAEECGAIYAFLSQKGWLPDPSVPSETVVASCLETRATRGYSECILGSTQREEAERCQ